jgi:hypothetical protein
VTRLDPRVEAALRRGKRQIMDTYRDDPNVTGAGVSFRIRGGRFTDEPVVTVMVARKRPAAMISRARLLPETVRVDDEEWGVDVVEAGPFSLHDGQVREAPADGRRATFVKRAHEAMTKNDGAFQPLKNKVRPPEQGCSISNLSDPENDGKVAGTLGCFVTDLVTKQICLLSCNHVIARLNQGQIGVDKIIQPGGLDGGVKKENAIGTLTAFAPLVDGTEVDAAIATLTDQTPSQGYTTEVMDDLMAPISPTHPTVGMVVAGDGINSFLTRMDATIAALNVQLLGASGGPGASSEVVAPELFMNLEKVGRTTAYTSATVLGIGFDIKVNTGGSLGVIEYDDTIWTLFFSLPGDSGSVACAGGDGNLLFVLVFLALLSLCLGEADEMATYYEIPVNSTENMGLAKQFQDKFLSQTITGQFLIAISYANMGTVTDRLKSRTGTAHNQATAQARAEGYYKQYHDLAAKVITGKDPTAVVTKSELDTLSTILLGLSLSASQGGTGMLTGAEATAAFKLYSDIAQPTLGMNHDQLIAYMNQDSVFQTVYKQVVKVPTIKLTEAIKTLGGSD